MGKIVILAALAARAYAACSGCTTVSGTIYNPNGSTYSGTLLISIPVPFTSADGHANLIGPAVTLTISGGALSVPLEPNDTAAPAGTYYTIKSAVAGLVSLTCRVPTSGSAVALLSICSATLPSTLSSSLAGSTAAASGALTFGTIVDGTCKDLTFAFSGITAPAELSAGWPSSLPAGVTGLMFASAAGTVDVRLCNLSGAPVSIGSLSYGAKTTFYTLSAAAAIVWPAIADGGCAQESLTLSGVLPGDSVVPLWPATLASGLSGEMLVSAANTIAINLCNWSGASVTPSATYGAAVAR